MTYLFAFLGGMILNVMPCVLPVVWLKAKSLQADRLPYVAGILSVFAALATLSVTLGWFWGQQFNQPWFGVGLTALVFIMGLNLLGVWELPPFGFRGSTNAYWTGVLSTVLATPCAGPLLSPVFGATLTQSPVEVYLTFLAMGLGFASPYLLPIPLPKPGEWMETFRQWGGWAMLATALWLLYGLPEGMVFPTLAVLLCIGMMLWRGRSRLTPVLAALTLLVGLTGFSGSDELPWQPYSDARFEATDRPIVYFTARWCLTCQLNERVLNSAAVRRAIERGGYTPLYAELDDESIALLRSLGYNSVPVLAIWGDDLVVLPDLVSERAILEAL